MPAKSNRIEVSFWAFIALMIAQRLWMILTGRIPLDSDEGIVGIQTAQMLHGTFFAFFRGQDYLGAFQSWLGLPAALVLGPGAWAVRLTALLQGVAIVVMWRGILTRLGAPQAALWFALLLAIPPEFVASFLIKSRGQVEVVFLGTALLAVLLRMSPEVARWPAWLGLGALTGLGWWTSQLVVFYLVPALIFLLMDEGWRRVLVGWFSPREGRWLRVFFVALLLGSFLLLILRPTVQYQSPLSPALFRIRFLILGIFAVAVVGYWRFAQLAKLPGWLLPSVLGFVLAYSPALWVYGTKVTVYNTTSLINPADFSANAGVMFFQLAGSTIGLLSPELKPWPLGAFGFAIVPCVYLLGVVIVGRTAWGASDSAAPARRFALLLMVWGCVLWVLIQKGFHLVSHYGLTPTIFLLLVMALALEQLGRLHRALPWLVVSPLLVVNVASAVWLPRERLELGTLTPVADAELLQFVRTQNVEVAATSLAAANRGYWDAYRLTLLSGMGLRVHPMTHMPRVVEFRDELRAAKQTVLIVVPAELSEVKRAFEKGEIPYKSRAFDQGLTVIYDFPKAKGEMLGLFEYRMSFDE